MRNHVDPEKPQNVAAFIYQQEGPGAPPTCPHIAADGASGDFHISSETVAVYIGKRERDTRSPEAQKPRKIGESPVSFIFVPN